jgi:hypothetical protein
MKAILDSSIRNLPLDIKDAPLTRKINGPDVETLKAKLRTCLRQYQEYHPAASTAFFTSSQVFCTTSDQTNICANVITSYQS